MSPSPPPLELVLDPAPVLHHRSTPVRVFDARLRRLAAEMFNRCEEWNGVGLAAPQVGRNIQLAVIVFEGQRLAFCNPELVATDGEVDAVEGCLSIPGRSGQVRRHERVSLRYRNLHGKGVQRDFEGWMARIVQHESDHLLGVLCPERLAPGATFEEVTEDGEGSEGGPSEEAPPKPRARPTTPRRKAAEAAG